MFLGGVKDIFAMEYPETACHHVLLKPGECSWVAEAPDPRGKGMLQEFTVPRRGL